MDKAELQITEQFASESRDAQKIALRQLVENYTRQQAELPERPYGEGSI